MVDKRIQGLSKSDATKALNVLSSHRIADVIKGLEGDCPSYECCPCNADHAGSPCGCNSECKCTKFGGEFTMEMAGIYEAIARATPVRTAEIVQALKARAAAHK